MSDPLAYFVTWTTYGSWLPGDSRGWTKKKRWGAQPPDGGREDLASQLMTEIAVVLSPEQRAVVDAVIVDHCRIRGWFLHACNVRTNHVHVVVTAAVEPKTVREQFKAWSSRRLSEQGGMIGGGKDGQRRWWTEAGDVKFVWDEEQLEKVNRYVLEGQ